MEALWFWIVAGMLAMYVVFDGFDLGAGAIHLWVARSDPERRAVLRSIGPVWDGNEVWLLAAGGTLYLAFPALYARSFSGFYLPLMIVLWLLILRGISLEFRNHVESPVWAPFWDVVFSAASAALAVFYGAALGNVVRGVPMNAEGRFFEPLWTDFRPGANAGILDWYTISVGVAALVALVMHGALWVALKTEGRVEERAKALAGSTWYGVGALTILTTVLSWGVQPHVRARMTSSLAGWIFPALALAGLAGVRWFLARRHGLAAFLSSSAYLVGMLASAAYGLYPYVLPSVTDPARGLTVHEAAAPRYGLGVGLVWWIPGILLVAAYFVHTYRRFSGKVTVEEPGY